MLGVRVSCAIMNASTKSSVSASLGRGAGQVYGAPSRAGQDRDRRLARVDRHAAGGGRSAAGWHRRTGRWLRSRRVIWQRSSSVPAGLDAKVVDGDQRMWLSVPAGETVVVLDYSGAPYLRFNQRGVQVNQGSAMYYLNQTPIAETPPAGLSATTPPRWQQASGGHRLRLARRPAARVGDRCLPAGVASRGPVEGFRCWLMAGRARSPAACGIRRTRRSCGSGRSW